MVRAAPLSAASASARDLLRLATVDDPQLTPDGTRVAWTRGTVDPERDAVDQELVLTEIEGSAFGRETVLWRGRGLRLARWSPDGRWLACVLPADGGSDVFAFDPFRAAAAADAPSAPPRRVTRGAGPVLDLAWSPAGDALALVAARHDGPPPATGAVAGVMRVTRLRWKRDGVGLIGDRFDHLGVVAFDPGAPASDRIDWCVRGRVDVAGPCWSPDGRTLAFVAELDDPAWEGHRRAAVYLVGRDAAAPPRRLAGFADVRAQALAWSPDGATLAVTGHLADGIGHYGAQRLWTVDVATGARRALTSDVDGTFGNAAYTDTGGSGGQGPVWDADGGGVLAVLSARGHVRLVHVDLAGAITTLTPEDRVVAGFGASRDGRRAVIVAQPRDRSGDLELVDLGAGAAPRRLTDHGGASLDPAAVATPRHLRVDDGRGPALDAWLLMPHARFGPKVPVVLYTGGGPGGMRADNFQFEWQLLVAHGYALVWVNARGCQGYGDPFCTAVLGSWGGADHVDQMRALDAALAAEPRLDPDRQAIAGGSYGGYAVVWAIAHERRFRAAVADRVVVDKLAAFGMSDIGPQRAFEFGGARPWEDPAAYLAQSPMDRLGGVRTPTLVVHSAEDHRCAVGQGEALYAGLRALGVETRLVRFPNESHGLSRGGRPWHRVRRLQEYLDWLARHLAPGAPEAA